MDPKNNFINSRPSIITNNEAERADNLATTDDELELGDNKDLKAKRKDEKPVTNTTKAGNEESFDPGLDEEA